MNKKFFPLLIVKHDTHNHPPFRLETATGYHSRDTLLKRLQDKGVIIERSTNVKTKILRWEIIRNKSLFYVHSRFSVVIKKYRMT